MNFERAALYTRSLIEASVDPLVAIDQKGKITDVNESMVKITGVPRKKLIGSAFSKYFTDPNKKAYSRVFFALPTQYLCAPMLRAWGFLLPNILWSSMGEKLALNP